MLMSHPVISRCNKLILECKSIPNKMLVDNHLILS